MDTGCPHTVAGHIWFETHMNSLSRKDKLSIKTYKSNNKFRFGNGVLYESKYRAIIPIYVGRLKCSLEVDVVQCNIPLLLSRATLQKANAKIDIGNALICFLGITIPLITSSTGHLCLEISRPLDINHDETQRVVNRVLFTSPIAGVGSDIKNKARKLHIQFCHPTAGRLINLVKNSGTTEQGVFDAITEVTEQCEICIKNKQSPLRPVVCFPSATSFNETVALDLKFCGTDGYILHIIDHLTRYSSACIIRNKRKETIIKGILDYWIRIFGCPRYFLTDNGGEFVNQDMIDFAEKFNITLKTTAAESPWSNGLCERHNGILNNHLKKIMSNNICSIDMAIHWAVAAKNSLANVYGFSPNMLVFGRNPNYPSGLTNSPPANNMSCMDEYVAQTLNAMHVARKTFIEQESAERLRRALNRKTRTYVNVEFYLGDNVFYWRNDRAECHGPAKVIGKDSKQLLLKHGGSYIRVHPCRVQHVNGKFGYEVIPFIAYKMLL